MHGGQQETQVTRVNARRSDFRCVIFFTLGSAVLSMPSYVSYAFPESAVLWIFSHNFNQLFDGIVFTNMVHVL